MGLTFEQLRTANEQRTSQVYFPVNHWNLMEWGCALAGEVGELCNKLKKVERDKIKQDQAVYEELADVLVYLDLTATRLGVRLEDCLVEKFNRDSTRRGSDIRLEAE